MRKDCFKNVGWIGGTRMSALIVLIFIISCVSRTLRDNGGKGAGHSSGGNGFGGHSILSRDCFETVGWKRGTGGSALLLQSAFQVPACDGAREETTFTKNLAEQNCHLQNKDHCLGEESRPQSRLSFMNRIDPARDFVAAVITVFSKRIKSPRNS